LARSCDGATLDPGLIGIHDGAVSYPQITIERNFREQFSESRKLLDDSAVVNRGFGANGCGAGPNCRRCVVHRQPQGEVPVVLRVMQASHSFLQPLRGTYPGAVLELHHHWNVIATHWINMYSFVPPTHPKLGVCVTIGPSHFPRDFKVMDGVQTSPWFVS